MTAPSSDSPVISHEREAGGQIQSTNNGNHVCVFQNAATKPTGTGTPPQTATPLSSQRARGQNSTAKGLSTDNQQHQSMACWGKRDAQNITTGFSYQILLRRGYIWLDRGFDSLEHFCQTESNKIGWFFLITLDKVGKEKDESRDSNSQPKCYRNDTRVSMSALKASLISSRLRV